MAKMEVTPRRLIPEDKVYRQIFDAEVSLVEALEKERLPPKSKTEPLLPLVRESRAEAGHGILTSRQKRWMQSRPNESSVENPVNFKYEALESIEKHSKPGNYFEALEVRGLPDSPRTTQKGTNIIQRLQSSRRERHESSLEDMYQEFGVINTELEPRIIESCGNLKELLLENDREIEQLLKTIESDDDLQILCLADLEALWKSIAEHSNYRQTCIAELDATLDQVENDRANLIRETLKGFSKILERVAHLMPADVHRLLEREAQDMNSTILMNRRAYADLISNLLTADVERERQCYICWEKRVEDWRVLQCNLAVNKFSDFMNSSLIKDPPELRQKFELFTAEQRSLNKKRLDLLESLRNMRPPNATKSAVYQWNTALMETCRQLEEVHCRYKDVIEAEYDRIIEQCMEEIGTVKDAFRNGGIIDAVRTEEVMNESFLPLVGEKQTKFEHEIDKMERSLDNLTSFHEMMIKSLFKFVQGAAHLWDLHEIGLARQERKLQEQLEKNRRDHDGTNQVKEANLDIIMDKLRQDSSEQALADSLKKALEALEEIKELYNEFHSQQTTTACSYPELVTEELKKYDDEVCKYFQVSTLNPTTERKEHRSLKQDRSKMKKKSKTPPSIDEVLTTSKGKTFYILREPGEHGLLGSPESINSMKTCATFLTDKQDELEDYDTAMPSYIEAIVITDELFLDLRKQIRLSFLEHLEDWKIQALDRADSVVAAKVEELNSELDLRLHLHEPRAARAEQDVHNVRAAELVMHRERVERHCKGVTTSLNEFKARFQEMIEEHDKETDIFKKSVQELESTFTSATKTHELLVIQDQVAGRIEEYMNVIRTSLRKFRHDLDEMLSTLRNSNARFRKTFKVFSDGGNFSTDEIDEYRKRLERMANKIDSAEGSVMAELEGMESKRLEAATDFAGKLEDRFKNHLFDLTFMEKVTRWLTNTQVKVKSEVAFSNSQAKKLAIYLSTFERHIDAVERPNLDKEQVTARQVQSSLIPILQTFHERSLYLNCLVNPATPSLALLHAGLNTSEQKNIDKEQKKPSEGTLRPKKSKRRISQSADKSAALEPAEPTTNEKGIKPKSTPSLSRVEKAAEGDGRPKTVPVELKAKSSDLDRQTGRQKSAGNRKTSASRREIVGPRYDKKYLVFGEKMEESRDFMARIRNTLREGLEGLLATAEMYYRQKGQRNPTRPQAIHENFDLCAEALDQRLISYKKQSEEYHNSCIQELRSQIQKFSVTLVYLPPLVVSVIVTEQQNDLEKEREVLENNRKVRIQELERRKTLHQSQLRPSLGHPHNRNEMDTLCASEEKRRQEALDGAKQHAQELSILEAQFAGSFIEKLAQTCETMLLQFDAVLSLDDVQVGRVEPKPKSSKRLLREKMLARGEDGNDKLAPFPSGGSSWEGLPTNELVLEDSAGDKKNRTPTVKTVKTTAGHVAVINARNKAYQDYKDKFESRLIVIHEAMSAQMQNEERWTRSWERSINKIKELY
ncbi:coiled-coil domain-containing protein 180-like [Acropora palmata]|uniref:coiled-coil domain-containing protein 180-like n=1 Tax=Acropora palmata TaxID=6131 RepID=UPI003DA16A07